MKANKVVEMATVLAVKTVAQGIVQATLRCPKIAARVVPGQFVTIKPAVPGKLLRRPFTVWSRRKDVIQLVFQVVGPNTEAYSRWQVGQEVELFGPIGRGIVINLGVRCVIMIAGGCGFASMYFPARQVIRQNQARLIVGAGFKSQAHVFGVQAFKNLGVELKYVTQEDGGRTAVDLFREIVFSDGSLPPSEQIQVLTCGPEPMMQRVAEICCDEGMACTVILERMIGCGTGDCMGCAVAVKGGGMPKHLCEDGPAFNGQEVIWNE